MPGVDKFNTQEAQQEVAAKSRQPVLHAGPMQARIYSGPCFKKNPGGKTERMKGKERRRSKEEGGTEEGKKERRRK